MPESETTRRRAFVMSAIQSVQGGEEIWLAADKIYERVNERTRLALTPEEGQALSNLLFDLLQGCRVSDDDTAAVEQITALITAADHNEKGFFRLVKR